METLTEIAIKIFVEAILITGIIGYFFSKREERMKKTIEEEFSKRDKFFEVRFKFKLRALEELLAPIKLQLIRSKINLTGYDANNEYREKTLKECNETIRSLLLEKGNLIPIDLMPYTEKFISHYDEWLQVYRANREIQNKTNVKHVFTYNFPHDVEKAFLEKFDATERNWKLKGP
ncbi:hypothetical protein [Mariniflexile sp. HMF6888]|uniref:hypothetical protein n=1 Tax=Mariniflexile sp. HMF6888 TaxID=3373086 RepID=UPI0037B25329